MDGLPQDMWVIVMDALNSRAAASFACACRSARAAYRESVAFRCVRTARDGRVLEPASGTFDVEVAPGEPLRDAFARCPRCLRGGSVLLRPETHAAFDLNCGDEVHVFGRSMARIEGGGMHSWARAGALVGVHMEDQAWILAGRLRLQQCTFGDAAGVSGGTGVTFDRCVFNRNLTFHGRAENKGRIEGCTFKGGSLNIDGASPLVSRNSFRHTSLFHNNVISVWNGGAPAILDNTIVTEIATTIGIRLDGAVGCIIEGNTVSQCAVGVYMENGSTARIERNQLWNENNVFLIQNSSAQIIENRIRGLHSCGRGVTLSNAKKTAILNNEIWYHDVGITVNDSQEVTIADNDVIRCKVGTWRAKDPRTTGRRQRLAKAIYFIGGASLMGALYLYDISMQAIALSLAAIVLSVVTLVD